MVRLSSCHASYWKSRHADTVRKNVKLQAELDQAKAEIRQLKDERFGKRSEKHSSADRSNELADSVYPPSNPKIAVSSPAVLPPNEETYVTCLRMKKLST